MLSQGAKTIVAGGDGEAIGHKHTVSGAHGGGHVEGLEALSGLGVTREGKTGQFYSLPKQKRDSVSISSYVWLNIPLAYSIYIESEEDENLDQNFFAKFPQMVLLVPSQPYFYPEVL